MSDMAFAWLPTAIIGRLYTIVEDRTAGNAYMTIRFLADGSPQ